ncbi:MAG: hypothetical protein DRJ67_12235 [Thermoprotei archaeon]|nr:MAG: hypothetical protein DRJ67_12235 [Thermoprotei archaeon]
MSVEVRLVIPLKLARALKRRAEREGMSLEELILLALARELEEEREGGGR